MTDTPPKCNTNKSQIKNGGLRNGPQASCENIQMSFWQKLKILPEERPGADQDDHHYHDGKNWVEVIPDENYEGRWQRSSLCNGHKKRWIGHLIWWWHHLYSQSESHMIAAETRTTTLPRASARTWRNTPWSLRWKLWQRWNWQLHWRLRWRFWKIFTSDVHLSSACKPLCLNECNE